MGAKSRGKKERIKADRLRVFLGQGSRGKLTRGLSVVDNTDERVGEIARDCFTKIRAKYPNGLPEARAKVDTYHKDGVLVVTRRLGQSYSMAVWSDEALQSLILEKGTQTDIVFNPEFLTEIKVDLNPPKAVRATEEAACE